MHGGDDPRHTELNRPSFPADATVDRSAAFAERLFDLGARGCRESDQNQQLRLPAESRVDSLLERRPGRQLVKGVEDRSWKDPRRGRDRELTGR
jgi:hypothetical protein